MNKNIEQEKTTSRLLLCPFVQYLIGKVFEVLFMRVFQWFFRIFNIKLNKRRAKKISFSLLFWLFRVDKKLNS